MPVLPTKKVKELLDDEHTITIIYNIIKIKYSKECGHYYQSVINNYTNSTMKDEIKPFPLGYSKGAILVE